MKKQMLTAVALLLGVMTAQAQQPGLSDYYLATVEAAHQETVKAPMAGTWLTQSGNLEVEIAACGQALCGKISKVLDTSSDASATPLLGKTIMEGFTAGNNATWSGRIFNRGDGQTYLCQMRMTSQSELEVTPYKEKPEQGRTQVWTRVSSAAIARSN